MTEPNTPQPEPAPPPVRIFLVVVDDSPESKVALRYACLRAKRSGGRVAMLYVIEPGEMQHFLAVEDLMREERRAEAEQKLQKLAREVNQIAGSMPAMLLREGNRRDELLALIEEDPKISILVLGAGTGSEGPGPLISYLLGRGLPRLRIPLTIVPGSLSSDQVEAFA